METGVERGEIAPHGRTDEADGAALGGLLDDAELAADGEVREAFGLERGDFHAESGGANLLREELGFARGGGTGETVEIDKGHGLGSSGTSNFSSASALNFW